MSFLYAFLMPHVNWALDSNCVKVTLLMVNGRLDDEDRMWRLGEVNVKRVKEYTYLGVTLIRGVTEL